MSKTIITEDLENNRLIIERAFNAPIEKLWKAWSDPAIMCKWWAPEPYVCYIHEMDFRVGGYMRYDMTGPEGDVYKGRMDFLRIDEFTGYETEDFFCDENGEKAGDIPPMKLKVTFDVDGETTKVTTTTTFASAEAMKQMAEMGAAEGWKLSMNQLEELVK